MLPRCAAASATRSARLGSDVVQSMITGVVRAPQLPPIPPSPGATSPPPRLADTPPYTPASHSVRPPDARCRATALAADTAAAAVPPWRPITPPAPMNPMWPAVLPAAQAMRRGCGAGRAGRAERGRPSAPETLLPLATSHRIRVAHVADKANAVRRACRTRAGRGPGVDGRRRSGRPDDRRASRSPLSGVSATGAGWKGAGGGASAA
eukprot:ctg_953.g222